MKTLPKFTQLNAVTDVLEPRYSTRDVLVACYKVNRSKLDIKLSFPSVSPTSEYYGEWFITKKQAKSRKKFNNNGLDCYVINWDEFEQVVIDNQYKGE